MSGVLVVLRFHSDSLVISGPLASDYFFCLAVCHFHLILDAIDL